MSCTGKKGQDFVRIPPCMQPFKVAECNFFATLCNYCNRLPLNLCFGWKIARQTSRGLMLSSLRKSFQRALFIILVLIFSWPHRTTVRPLILDIFRFIFLPLVVIGKSSHLVKICQDIISFHCLQSCKG